MEKIIKISMLLFSLTTIIVTCAFMPIFGFIERILRKKQDADLKSENLVD